MLAVLLGTAQPALAQADPHHATEVLQVFDRTADRIEELLEGTGPGDLPLETMSRELESARTSLRPVKEIVDGRLGPLRDLLTSLGDPPAPDGPPEDPDVATERARLIEAIANQEAIAKQIGLSETRAETLAARIDGLRRDRFASQLMTRGMSPLSREVVTGTLGAMTELVDGVGREIADRARIADVVGQLANRLALPTFLALIGVVLAVGMRRWAVRRLLAQIGEDDPMPKRLALGSMLAITRLLLPTLALGLILAGAAYSGLLGPRGEVLVRGLTLAFGFVIGAYALGGAYFAPYAAGMRLADLDDACARASHRWLIALTAAVGANVVLVAQAEDLGLPLEAQVGLNAIVLALGGALLWAFVDAARFGLTEPHGTAEHAEQDDDEDAPRQPGAPALNRIGRVVLRTVAVLAPLLAVAGFYGASRYVFFPVIFSAAVIGICYLLYRIVSTVVDQLAGPAVRGEETGQDAPERLRLIPVIVAALLGSAALPILAMIWGADATDLARVWRQAVAGFTVGDVTIAPFDFITFLAVFSLGYLLTRLAQGLLARSVLPLTRLDSGGRSAILAGVGYTGVILSALAAISSTELDLTNLAIVAGALSVGIGFGLQNIVNNFVSGVILLIERPIKQGDWVEIGGVHGTVQQVNVRSTEIQTFDRSTMFVPNADLISGTVTNWTHANSYGRLIVGVGVAYGSDARQVEKVLLEIARGNPMLLRRPAPYVLFAGFGADSLDFEIRGVLRDVNWILNVASDIRFEIYERFTAEGIEIPFAQRDLHLKNIGELGEALRGRVDLSKPES